MSEQPEKVTLYVASRRSFYRSGNDIRIVQVDRVTPKKWFNGAYSGLLATEYEIHFESREEAVAFRRRQLENHLRSCENAVELARKILDDFTSREEAR